MRPTNITPSMIPHPAPLLSFLPGDNKCPNPLPPLRLVKVAVSPKWWWNLTGSYPTENSNWILDSLLDVNIIGADFAVAQMSKLFWSPQGITVASNSRFLMMEDPKVKLSLNLGSETYSLNSGNGVLSEQLAAVKEASMVILKDFITKHNAPNHVPDELAESSSEDESGKLGNPPKKTKKQK